MWLFYLLVLSYCSSSVSSTVVEALLGHVIFSQSSSLHNGKNCVLQLLYYTAAISTVAGPRHTII